MSSTTISANSTGRDAAAPHQIPLHGWWAVLRRTWAEAGHDNLGLVAAGVAFYAFLAPTPLLAAIILSYGLFADPATVERTLLVFAQALPPDAAGLLGEQLLQITNSGRGQQGLGLLLALAFALYGAMRGASAIITALNIIYDEEERRSFIKLNLLALAMTVATVLLAMGSIIAMTAFNRLGIGNLLIWPLYGLVAVAMVAMVYRYGPSRECARWRWLTPGSIFTCLGWLAASAGFAIYVGNFADYNATYGGLGAVVVLLTWLYLSAYVLLFGAELNAELEHQTARDTTTGAPEPLGVRGAKMADSVAE
jgi:membrane protein